MYQLIVNPINPASEEKIIRRISDGASIPLDLNNVDYQLYLNWVLEGNTAELWDPLTTI
jgi:hypothetical protein